MTTYLTDRTRRALVILGILAVAVSLTAALPNSGQGHPRPTVKAVPRIEGKLPPPLFEDRVNTVASTKYPSAFAGEEVTRSGHLIIYVVQPKAKAFLAFLRRTTAAPHSGTASYTLVPVKHSWAQLNTLTARIDAQFKQLKAIGIRLSQWGPDPASNKVKITLGSYSRRAARELVKRFGPQWVSVNKTSGGAWEFTSSRYEDTPPFFGGDAIWFAGQSHPSCQAGLSWTLNTTGATFTFVADHCVKDAGGSSGTEIFTNNTTTQNFGDVSTEYLDSRRRDVASVVGQYAGRVWGNSTTNYAVIGAELAPKGAGVTFSGRIYGEVRDVTVENINQDIPILNTGITILDATVATKTGSNVCNLGDSGGPWIQHNNTANQVNAVGIQSAVRINPDGSVDPSVCVYEQITNMLSLVNGTIQKG